METIIIATDGSDTAKEAASRGLALLRPVERVLVVSVADLADPDLADDATGHAAATMTPDEIEAENEKVVARGQSTIDATVEALRAHPGLPPGLETRILGGQAGPALCHLASETEAIAVVMGSSGRGGLRRAVLGSVSDHVVRHAPCPVVVTRARPE
jgi:nucleotide-binding universal stress UspA family protein